MAYTDGVSSPPAFRLWAGICCLAGAMERRVWVNTANSFLYPNMFIALVGAPGVGKGEAIRHVEHLWYAAKRFKIAPEDVSRASIVDVLADSQQVRLVQDQPVEYCSLLVPAEEMGVFITAHDLSFLSFLNKIWNCPKIYRERKRHLKKEIEIPKPQITLLTGTQPDFLASLMPEEAWGMGFMSRCIMIYASSPVRVPLFDWNKKNLELEESLISDLDKIADLYGCFQWNKDAMALLMGWQNEGFPPVPEHSKLVNYNSRRIVTVLKLSMVSAISKGLELIISHDDVRRAIDWLLEAERLMPDIFREMAQKSDSQVIQDLHFHLWRIWVKEKKPIHESRLFHFLQTRVPSEKVVRVIEIAERANIIARSAGTQLYIPRARHEFGVE